MTLLILYLALAILVSFLCSILEAVLLSITPSYIQSLKEKNKEMLSIKLETLKSNIDKPLAAILSFNTIAHTVGAAGVGAQAAKVFGNDYLGLTSAALTLLILIFSEIIPKTIGANYWKRLDGFTANTLRILIIMMYPLVMLSMFITKLLSTDEKTATVSRAELSAMADIGEKEGVFKKTESKMIKNMVAMRNITVEDVMTPRTVIVMVQEDESIANVHENKSFDKFSRIPVFKKNRDDITGYVHKIDMLTKLADDQHQLKLKDIKREIMLVPHNTNLPATLDKIMEEKEHMALVTDRYGGVAGLVTMEDIMETLLGREIVDEFDSIEDMQKYARERWRLRAKKLGLIMEDDQSRKETDHVIKYGITGGQSPGGQPEDSKNNDKGKEPDKE